VGDKLKEQVLALKEDAVLIYADQTYFESLGEIFKNSEVVVGSLD
jgi:hypothetical protein